MTTSLRKWLNVFLFIFVLVVNYLASTGKLNRMNTGDISDMYQVLITPAGYVFSIWGLIYLFLLIFVIYQAMPKYEDAKPVKAIGPLFIITCVTNASWLFAWHYKQFVLAELIMICFLITLIIIMNRLYAIQKDLSLFEKRVFCLPFSVYFGWISVATIANTSLLLVFLKWTQFGITAEIWTIILLFIIMLLGLSILTLKDDKAYVWVFVWASIGIAVKNYQTFIKVQNSQGRLLIVVMALIVIAFLLRNLLASYLKLVPKAKEEPVYVKKHPAKKK